MRTALATTGVAIAFPAGAIAALSGVDPHPVWAREMALLADRIDADDDSDPRAHERRVSPFYERLSELEDLIAYTPSNTAAGAREQILMVATVLEVTEMSDRERTALENVAATLERLAGAAGHA